MKFDQLHTVLTVAEFGSFHLAAEKLHRTQSAISHAVKNFEQEIGLQIFDRSAYRANVTDVGNAFLKQARKLMAEESQLLQFAKILATGIEPRIRIMVNSLCMSPQLLAVLRDCHQAYPDTQFEISCGTLSAPLTMLAQNKVDLIINTKGVDQSGIEFVKLGSITLINVIQEQVYKTKKLHRALTQQQLKDLFQVIVTDFFRTKEDKKDSSKFGVAQQSPHWLVGDHYTKKNVILAGLGWGRLPKHMIEPELKAKQLRAISVKGVESPLELTVVAARRLNAYAGPVFTYLWNQLATLKFNL